MAMKTLVCWTFANDLAMCERTFTYRITIRKICHGSDAGTNLRYQTGMIRDWPGGKSFGKWGGGIPELPGAFTKLSCCPFRVPEKNQKCMNDQHITTFPWPG